MKYLSSTSIKEDIDEVVWGIEDTIESFKRLSIRLTAANAAAKEIERQLNRVAHDYDDPYDPVAKSLRLIEEIINATD